MSTHTPWMDRALPLLVGTSLMLGVQLVWARTWELSCWALLAPGITSAAIAYGVFEHRLHRKRFALDYYLAETSPWRRRLRGPWLIAVTSALVGLPFGVFLAVFVALSRPSDWAFLAGAVVVAPVCFVAAGAWPGCHFRRGTARRVGVAAAEVIASRLAGWVLLAAMAVTYVYLNYSQIETPEFICVANDGSFSVDALLCTGENFAAGVHSTCPLIDTVVRMAAWIEGTSWWLVTSSATDPRIPDGIAPVAWIVFFANAALAFAGFVRGLEGCMLLATRLARRPGHRALRPSGPSGDDE